MCSLPGDDQKMLGKSLPFFLSLFLYIIEVKLAYNLVLTSGLFPLYLLLQSIRL